MMKRKILAVMLAASMVASMAIGCGKETETSAPVESTTSTETKEVVTAVTFTGEKSFTAVQGEAVNFSELVRKAEVKAGFDPKTITIQYGETEFVMDTDKDLPKNEDGADVTVAMEKDAKTLMGKDNLPNITLTFADVTSEPETLTVQMDLAGSEDEEGTGEIQIPVTVVPKAVAEVKALTENLKIAESLDNYDFAVRASNIQGTLSEDSNIKLIAVKDSDVKFQTPGHYTVTYEVTFKEPIKVTVPVKEDTPNTTDESNTADKTDTSEATDTAGGSDTTDESNTQDSSKDETVTEEVPSVDIPTDVTIVGKDETEDYDKDDIIDENIKPGDKVETSEDKEEASEDDKEDASKDEDTSDDKGNSSESGNTSSGNTSSGGNSSSGGNTSSGGSSSSGGNTSGENTSGGGSSSGGGSTSKPHTHNYVSSVTKQPTCTSTGTRTYTCSCGDSYTETIAKTSHSWVDRYETKTIPPKTHTENVIKQVCGGCGAQFDTADEAAIHIMKDFYDNCQNYSSKVVDTITIIDEPAKTEQVYKGKQCSVCGTWQ